MSRSLQSLCWTTALLVVAAISSAQQHESGEQGHGRHGNPADLDTYIERLQDPERDAWQLPDRVIGALQLKAGQVVCDIGTGPGYFALRLAKVLGPGGHVYAVDVEPTILGALLEALRGAGASNVTPVLALPEDPLLPHAACDVVLIVNTYHHFPDGPAYLRRLTESLAPEGRVVNIDFHPSKKGAPRHSIDRAAFLSQAEVGGLALEREERFLSRQYFLVLRPRD